MTNDLPFRVTFSILWIIFIANLIWAGHSSREPKSSSSIAEKPRQRGRLHIAALAFIVFFWFGLILYSLLPSWIMFLSIPLPEWFRLIMIGVAIPSILFTLWGLRALGENWVGSLEPSTTFLQRKEKNLVTSGPYQYVRNPIYLGGIIFIIALGLGAANWLLLLPALGLALIHYILADKEEVMLIDAFGDAYREYMKRVPRFIPKHTRH